MSVRTRIAAVLLGGIIASVAVLGGAASAKSTTRPLTGTFQGGNLNFSGQMTHLGDPFYGQILTIDLGTGHFTETWTAVNGDQVFSSGVVTFGGTSFSEEITITGGTGRFSGATGSVTATGQLDAGFGAYHGAYSGTIGF